MFADFCVMLPFAAATGETFRALLPFLLAGGLVLIVVHLAASRLGRGMTRPAAWNWWRRLLYAGTVAVVLLLGWTAFVPVLREGAIGGWWLFAHMFAAGAMTVLLPLAALTWAEAHRCCGPCRGETAAPAARAEGTADAAPTSGKGADVCAASPEMPCLAKAAFWVLLASGLAVIATMILSMMPWFGTEGMNLLLDVHRYAGVIAVVAVLVHLYSVLLQKFAPR